jgi:hypothetical protein
LKREVDAELFPFHVLAMTWSGGVMLGPGKDKCDDQGYAELLQHVAQHGELPKRLDESLIRMLECGAGLPELLSDRAGIATALEHQVEEGSSKARALAYDLTFPEVFYPTAVVYDRKGFHVVLGNPPWDALQPLAKEFYAAFDLDILNAPTRLERESIETRLTSDPDIQRAFLDYVGEFGSMKRVVDRCYEHVNRSAGGGPSGAVTDVWQLFAEKGLNLARYGGRIGWVLPSAFHANQSATGIRELYLTKAALECCYSFENRRRLFDILSSFKFANVIAQREQKGTNEVEAAFYLHDDDWLYGERSGREALKYTPAFINRTGKEYSSFLELRSRGDLAIAEACFSRGIPFGGYCQSRNIRFGEECHMAKSAWRFTPATKVLVNGKDPRDPNVAAHALRQGYLVLHEGKTFRQFNDRWSAPPRYLVSIKVLSDKADCLRCSRYYRAAHREIAGPGDENVSIWSLLPPGCVNGHKAPVERTPWDRPNSTPLTLLGVANSYAFDWLLSLRVRASVSAFMRDSTPIHDSSACAGFVSHGVLRFTGNHSGYAPLWREQVSDAWREPKPPFTWPVLATDDERWEVRAAIDTVVADAYGLNRDQYAHVLATFSHKSYPKAPELCLAKFDELKRIGLEAFTRKSDPYWDIPLNENLPQPVIELPNLSESDGERFTLGEPAAGKRRGKGRAKGRKP